MNTHDKLAAERAAFEVMPLLDALIDCDPDAAERIIEKHLGRLALRKRLTAKKARAALEAKPAPEPVAYWFRHINTEGEPTNDWAPVEPRNPHVGTVQDRVRELLGYRYEGKPCYEVMPLYAAPAAPDTCWACNDTGTVTTSSNGSGLIDEACSACAAPAVPAPWQPIDTAPKDGDVLIYVAESDEQFVAYWDDCWRFAPNAKLKTPTHWMPLPAAPEASKGGAA